MEALGFESTAAGSELSGTRGYLALLREHERVATSFTPVARVVISLATHAGGQGVMLSAAIFWPDGAPSGKISSVWLGAEAGSAASAGRGEVEQTRVVGSVGSVSLLAREGGGGEGVQGQAIACLQGGAACESVCGWDGAVPKVCESTMSSLPDEAALTGQDHAAGEAGGAHPCPC